MKTAETIAILAGHATVVTDAVFSSDGLRVATASQDGTAIIWDAETGRKLRVFQGHTLLVRRVLWSPDDRFVLTGSADGTARIWSVENGASQQLTGHQGYVSTIAWNSSGNRIATGSFDRTVRLWAVSFAGRHLDVKPVAAPIQHQGRITSLQFSSDGKWLISAAGNGPNSSEPADPDVRVIDPETGAVIQILRGHTDKVFKAAVTSDGQRIVSTSADKTVRVWSTKTWETERTLQHDSRVTRIACHPNRPRIAMVDDDRIMHIWDVETGTALAECRGHDDQILSVQFSPDGNDMLSASDDHTARRWLAARWYALPVINDFSGNGARVETDHCSRMVTYHIRQDRAILYEYPTGRRLGNLETAGPLTDVTFSPDRSLILLSHGPCGMEHLAWQELAVSTRKRVNSDRTARERGKRRDFLCQLKLASRVSEFVSKSQCHRNISPSLQL